MESIYFKKTVDLRNAAPRSVWNLGLVPDPAAPGDWRTGMYATLACTGLPALLKGDIVEANLEHEFDTENEDTGGASTVHFYAWAMASTRVLIGTSAQLGQPNTPILGQGFYVIPPKETNWDWLIHHLGISRFGKWQADKDYPAGMCVYDAVYFKASGAYWPAWAPVQINAYPYAGLTVEVRRP